LANVSGIKMNIKDTNITHKVNDQTGIRTE